MKNLTVQTVYDWLDGAVPFESQEVFDNAGLQAGHPEQEVKGILLALDATPAVVKEALQLGCSLIISHHPLIFAPLASAREDQYVPRTLALLIRHSLGLISAHTNLDKSAFGGGPAMLKRLGLDNIRRLDDYIFAGDFAEEMTSEEVQSRIAEALGSPAVCYHGENTVIRTLAAAGGAYSEGFAAARLAGADALLTGEVRHHHAVEAAEAGLVLFEGGHFATEEPMMGELAQGLQSALDGLEYSVQVYVSRQIPYLRD